MLVTGAASGIGAALARRFARDGARLALLDRDRAPLEAVAAGLGAEALCCDVTDQAATRAAVQEACSRLGGLDVLVNNAGITHLSRFAETDPAVLRRVMEVNYFGAVHCTHAALPALVERRGLVVVVSSVAGFAPLAGRAGYAASKHALHGLFESLRAEWQPLGVGVLMVCPAFVRTAIGDHALAGDGGPVRQGERTTTGRALAPERVADAVFRAAARRRRRLLVSPLAHASWWTSRWAPGLYARWMAHRLLPAPEAGATPPARSG